MKRNSDLQKRFPAFYDHDKLKAKRLDLKLEIKDVSRGTGIPYASIQRAEAGTASNKIIYPLTVYYGMNYMDLFALPRTARPKQTHLAVAGTGGSLSAR